MLDRAHIEKLLKLNGVAPTAADEEIKSVLISARWHKDDVETALLILRENLNSHEAHIDTLHKVFRSDEQLDAEMISALLGVDISLTPEALKSDSQMHRARISFGQMVQIGLVSLSASVICLLASMWYLQIGVFHTGW